MISKNLFFNLVKEDLKRRLWLIALVNLIFFFIFPVAVAWGIGTNYYGDEYYRLHVEKIFNSNNGWIIFTIVVISIVSGMTGFSYLHSKKKCDFYHSIPVCRKRLFAARYFSGVVIFAGAYLIQMLLGLFVVAISGLLYWEFFLSAIVYFFYFLIYFLLMYATVILAMVLTGNGVVGLLGIGVFNFYGPILGIVFTGCVESFLMFQYEIPYWTEHIFISMSPFLALTTGIQKYSDYIFSDYRNDSGIWIVLACGAAISFFAFYLYLKRPSEAAGKAIAFEGCKSVIRIPLVILSTLMGGLIFWNMSKMAGWCVFGLICGCMISHCIIEIIMNFDFKKLFSHKMQMAFCGCSAALILSVFAFDLFGYDSYIPREKDIEYASLCIGNLNSWVEYGEYISDWEDGIYRDEYNYIFSHMRLTDYQAVLSIARKGIEKKHLPKEEYGYYRVERIVVQYRLKNGKTVRRKYYVPLLEIEGEVAELYQKPAYQNGVFPILTDDREDVVGISVSGFNDILELRFGGRNRSVTERDRIFAAYQQDLKGLSFQTMSQEVPIGKITFIEKLGLGKSKFTSSFQVLPEIEVEYPIYPSFKNTIQALNQYSFSLEYTGRDVGKIEVYCPYGSNIVITDQKAIQTIIKKISLREFSSMNHLYDNDDMVELYVYEKKDTSSDNLSDANNSEDYYELYNDYDFNAVISIKDLPEEIRTQYRENQN